MKWDNPYTTRTHMNARPFVSILIKPVFYTFTGCKNKHFLITTKRINELCFVSVVDCIEVLKRRHSDYGNVFSGWSSRLSAVEETSGRVMEAFKFSLVQQLQTWGLLDSKIKVCYFLSWLGNGAITFLKLRKF